MRLANSDDLIHWTPVEESPGKPVVVLERRPRLFDSGFPEVGTPPILTTKGILVLYNGKMPRWGITQIETSILAPILPARPFSIPIIPRGFAAAGQACIASGKNLRRSGQYAAGTTFAEGLVYFKGQWFLYYGCADSFVALATSRAVILQPSF